MGTPTIMNIKDIQEKLDDVEKKLQECFNVGHVQIKNDIKAFKVIYTVKIEKHVYHCIINFSYNEITHVGYIVKMLTNEVDRGLFKVIFK